MNYFFDRIVYQNNILRQATISLYPFVYKNRKFIEFIYAYAFVSAGLPAQRP
ncbi:MAG: hypothetical protein OJF59_002764 [Cytophagales bacterium]|nr:MAG: hypothetical protein OJF59_002764 [Cytophagales bacterium]